MKLLQKGYMDLRLSLASDLPSEQYIHEAVAEQDSPVQVMEKIFSANQEALGNTLNKIDINVFDQAVNILTHARRIEFYGSGGSGSVARDAHHKFFRLGVPCIAYEDSHMQVISAALLASDCVVIAISATGSSRDVIDSVQIAKKSGAQTIGITGPPSADQFNKNDRAKRYNKSAILDPKSKIALNGIIIGSKLTPRYE